MDILFLIGGIAVVILGANWLVDGASAIAKKLGISDIVVGLTIVAFGTSAPELTVNIFSALKGSTDIAIGNVLGSNISNILLILGITCLINPVEILTATKWKEIPFSLLAVLVMGIVSNDVLIDGANSNFISMIDGFILLSFMTIFMVYTFEMARRQSNAVPVDIYTTTEGSGSQISLIKAIFFIGLGLLALFFGGKYLVEGAVSIAKILGMSEKVIGLTIIAIGTSLPELATSAVAAYKKKSDIAVGNIVGSNIFNVFFVLGTTSVITPIPFDSSVNFDIGVAMIASILLFVTTVTFRKQKIDRVEGLIFLSIYTGYIAFSIMG
ncbi:MAG: calcium/sodium antiporter [Bacteroidales bacterium]|nr:calcium/sodium antiporter [Bacteroidales bacterium]